MKYKTRNRISYGLIILGFAVVTYPTWAYLPGWAQTLAVGVMLIWAGVIIGGFD